MYLIAVDDPQSHKPPTPRTLIVAKTLESAQFYRAFLMALILEYKGFDSEIQEIKVDSSGQFEYMGVIYRLEPSDLDIQNAYPIKFVDKKWMERAVAKEFSTDAGDENPGEE